MDYIRVTYTPQSFLKYPSYKKKLLIRFINTQLLQGIKNMSTSKWVKVAVHQSQLKKIDKLVRDGIHSSRQSAINYYVRRGHESQETIVHFNEILETVVTRLDSLQKACDSIVVNQETNEKSKK